MLDINLQLHAETETSNETSNEETSNETSNEEESADDGIVEVVNWEMNKYHSDILEKYKSLFNEEKTYPDLMKRNAEAYKPQQAIDKLHNLIDVVGGCICNLQLSFMADGGKLGYGLTSDTVEKSEDENITTHTNWYTFNIPIATTTVAGLISATDRVAMNKADEDIQELQEAMSNALLEIEKLKVKIASINTSGSGSNSGSSQDGGCSDSDTSGCNDSGGRDDSSSTDSGSPCETGDDTTGSDCGGSSGSDGTCGDHGED